MFDMDSLYSSYWHSQASSNYNTWRKMDSSKIFWQREGDHSAASSCLCVKQKRWCPRWDRSVRCKHTDQSAAAIVCLMSLPANEKHAFTYTYVCNAWTDLNVCLFKHRLQVWFSMYVFRSRRWAPGTRVTTPAPRPASTRTPSSWGSWTRRASTPRSTGTATAPTPAPSTLSWGSWWWWWPGHLGDQRQHQSGSTFV